MGTAAGPGRARPHLGGTETYVPAVPPPPPSHPPSHLRYNRDEVVLEEGMVMNARGSGRKPAPRKRPNAGDGHRRLTDARSASSRTRNTPSRTSSTRNPRGTRSAPSRNTPSRNAQRRRGPRRSSKTSFPLSFPSFLASSTRGRRILIGVIAFAVFLLTLSLVFCGHGTKTQDESHARGSYSVSFTTTGDLIFWREVADYIDMNGGASAMANIDDMLAQADVTISNVESPLSDNESAPIANKDIYIIGRPSAIEGIRNSGIDIVSLANNHIMDYTGPALQDTLNALDGAGVLHAGAGMTEEEAGKPVETTVNGVSVAFFSWTDIIPENYLAFGDQPGVVSARMNLDDACRRVREAKETHDIVIVAMHWGVQYQDHINDNLQREPAHKLVDAGADVIVGNHPHVLQGIEFYNGSLIAYAHGNCVFRQAHEFGHTHESYVLNFDITDSGIQNVVATPLYLDDTYGIPSIATGEQAQTTLNRLVEISEGMNTSFELRDDKAYISPQT